MSNFNTSNLIPLTSPLQPGQRLLKRPDGSFIPVGVQGSSGGSTGSMNFYKCSYVNSDSWGGYKAIQDPQTGFYSFQSNSTQGLHYLGAVPQLNKIYSEDSLVTVSYLYDGDVQGILARYPLTSDAKDISGNNKNGTVSGTLTFNSSGVRGFSNNNYITVPVSLTGTPFTVCMWLYQYQNSDLNWRVLFRVSGTACFYSTDYVDRLGLCVDETEQRSTFGDFRTAPMHVAVTWDPSTYTCQDYKNGVRIGIHTYSGKTWGSGSMIVGANPQDGNYYADKFVIRDLLFVNRVLTPAEITKIMNQGI